MIFQDRYDAGRKLAERLLKYKNHDTVIVSLPRGGVPVGYEITKRLGRPLKVLPVRKIGSPTNPEYAIGALAPDVLYWEESIAQKLGLTEKIIANIVSREIQELQRYQNRYPSDTLRVKNKIVVLTDDGLATGATAKAAIMALKKRHPLKIILAVPGGPLEVANAFEKLVDEVICIEKKINFTAVGEMYRNFGQIEDEEVEDLMQKADTLMEIAHAL